jgi:hypothetical protein
VSPPGITTDHKGNDWIGSNGAGVGWLAANLK